MNTANLTLVSKHAIANLRLKCAQLRVHHGNVITKFFDFFLKMNAMKVEKVKLKPFRSPAL